MLVGLTLGLSLASCDESKDDGTITSVTQTTTSTSVPTNTTLEEETEEIEFVTRLEFV